MIIDIHGHLGNINLAPFWTADAGTLERYARESRVDRVCVSSARSLMYDTMEGNRELDHALNTSEHLLGYVTVNPMFPETIRDLKLIENNTKFKGVKVHPDYHGYDIRSLKAQGFLDEVAHQISLMLFHVSCMPGTGFASVREVVRFAEKHPETIVVMAHLAGIFQNANYPYFPNFQGIEIVRAAQCPNIYVDTAHYLMYVYPGVMERVVETLGPEHLVFGTDVPLQGPRQMRYAIETIEALGLSLEEKAMILGNNSQRILSTESALL